LCSPGKESVAFYRDFTDDEMDLRRAAVNCRTCLQRAARFSEQP
jgi:hypothetical protein